jgi:peroxiredoxin
MALQPGTPAPDFALQAHSGDIKLSDFRGKTLVLGFHPASFTGG